MVSNNESPFDRSIRKLSENQHQDMFILTEDDSSLFFKTFLAGIVGPPETPYEDGIFFIRVSFDEWFKESQVKFLTKIIHPNISDDREILVEKDYLVGVDVEKSLKLIIEILKQPRWELTKNKEMLQICRENEGKYINLVKDSTSKYAI